METQTCAYFSKLCWFATAFLRSMSNIAGFRRRIAHLNLSAVTRFSSTGAANGHHERLSVTTETSISISHGWLKVHSSKRCKSISRVILRSPYNSVRSVWRHPYCERTQSDFWGVFYLQRNRIRRIKYSAYLFSKSLHHGYIIGRWDGVVHLPRAFRGVSKTWRCNVYRSVAGQRKCPRKNLVAALVSTTMRIPFFFLMLSLEWTFAPRILTAITLPQAFVRSTPYATPVAVLPYVYNFMEIEI